MTFGSLFTGIGGFDLGLERAGMACKWQVEINPFCNKVLEKHWPGVKRYGDIKTVENLEPVDLICGGPPCQPFSCAGKRRGRDDDRFLWPEMLRVISEVRPSWIIAENVAGIVNMALEQVCADLENEGYEVQAFIIPACAIGAPHRRDRVWIVANSRSGSGRKGGVHRPGEDPGKMGQRPSSLIGATDCHAADGYWDESWYSVALRTCSRRMDDGLPRGVDRTNRLKALGNSIVPQIAEIIGRAIKLNWPGWKAV